MKIRFGLALLPLLFSLTLTAQEVADDVSEAVDIGVEHCTTGNCFSAVHSTPRTRVSREEAMDIADRIWSDDKRPLPSTWPTSTVKEH